MNLKCINADIVAGIILLIISAGSYNMASGFDNPDAALWPKAVILLIVIFTALVMANGFKKMKENTEAKEADFTKAIAPVLTLVAIALYAVLMEHAGFFIATAIFCPLSMYALGQRNWLALIGVTAGLNLFVYVLFVMQLELQMP